ncbi:MAG: aminotransferase class V-fold PLP-dependent enzyme [Luminiphilus sp.]
MSNLIQQIRDAIIGDHAAIDTPFGVRPLIYADYTASGRSLSFIEDFIRNDVLPYYANTHTETSFTGAQTTLLREQAREIIRQAVNGTHDDKVIFCGSGATAAINKLIDMLNLRLPKSLSDDFGLDGVIPAEQRPVVFIGPYEHHSNELPWRESIADVVVIPLDGKGQLDLTALEVALTKYIDRPLRIGSFSAASNVTGVTTDVPGVTSMLKRHGALAFFDYAAAAPYTGIDMNGHPSLDGVFISPHKFIGGPGTPGVLIVKGQLLKNPVPAIVGGGTVTYVTPEDHRYISDSERREEGGTPGIVESIRAGLVFKLQQDVGVQEIARREHAFISRAITRLAQCEDLEILGLLDVPRLSILSLRFKRGDKDLHYGFVVSLLNDLFGIQARGGCSCAGPYGHSLLGMDMSYSRAIESQIAAGNAILRPGWVRLNFNYFISEAEFDYLLGALELVARHGWRLLPCYHFDMTSGVWRFHSEARSLPVSLEGLSFDRLEPTGRATPSPWELRDLLAEAERELTSTRPKTPETIRNLPDETERLRWFALP